MLTVGLGGTPPRAYVLALLWTQKIFSKISLSKSDASARQIATYWNEEKSEVLVSISSWLISAFNEDT